MAAEMSAPTDASRDPLEGDAGQSGSAGDIKCAVERLVDAELSRNSLDDEVVVVGASAGVELG